MNGSSFGLPERPLSSMTPNPARAWSSADLFSARASASEVWEAATPKVSS